MLNLQKKNQCSRQSTNQESGIPSNLGTYKLVPKYALFDSGTFFLKNSVLLLKGVFLNVY